MTQLDGQALVDLLYDAADGWIDFNDPRITIAIERMTNPELLSAATSFDSKEYMVIFLQAMSEDRIRRLSNAELVGLARSVEAHWPLFLPDGGRPCPAPSVLLAEVLLERFDHDVGVPDGTSLQIGRLSGPFDVELVRAGQNRHPYVVNSEDCFVAVTAAAHEGPDQAPNGAG